MFCEEANWAPLWVEKNPPPCGLEGCARADVTRALANKEYFDVVVVAH